MPLDLPFVISAGRHDPQPRSVIDKFQRKLGTKTAWQRLDYEELNFPSVQTTFQSMQKDGRWPEVDAL